VSIFSKPKIEDGDLCPLLDRACEKSRCRFWKRVISKDPQTGIEHDGFDCTFSWSTALEIKHSQTIHALGVEVNELRNLMSEGIIALVESVAPDKGLELRHRFIQQKITDARRK